MTLRLAIFYKMQIIAMMLLQPKWIRLVVAVALVCATSTVRAQDKIVFTDGRVQKGTILGAGNGKIQMRVGSGGVSSGELDIPVSQITSIDMAAPSQLAQAAGKKPPVAIALLAPLVGQFRGLPAAWLVDAMGQLAAAYSDNNQPDKALALYEEIKTTYPNSKFEMVATTGIAREELKQGNTQKTLSLLKPVIKASNENLMPSSGDSRLFGDAYLVRGQAFESAGMHDQALESYLAVITVFYHNPRAVAEAEKRTEELRAKKPEVMVR